MGLEIAGDDLLKKFDLWSCSAKLGDFGEGDSGSGSAMQRLGLGIWDVTQDILDGLYCSNPVMVSLDFQA